MASKNLTADKILQPDEARRLLRLLCSEMEKSLAVGKDLSVVTDYYLLSIAWNTGLRISEVHKLDWQDVKMDFLVIREGKGQKPRTVFFGEKTSQLFQKYSGFRASVLGLAPEGAVFTGRQGRLSMAQIHRRAKGWFQRAGFSGELSFHSLRHGYATRMIEEGVTLPLLREQLGHSSISTTSIYLHFTAKAREVLARAT